MLTEYYGPSLDFWFFRPGYQLFMYRGTLQPIPLPPKTILTKVKGGTVVLGRASYGVRLLPGIKKVGTGTSVPYWA